VTAPSAGTTTHAAGRNAGLRIILFGASGMVGQGVLRECLLDPGVERVLSVGRSATGVTHPKLQDLVHADLFDYRAVEADLRGFDACFFCLGVSAGGLSEAAYTRITFDLTLAAAQALAWLNPSMTFIYISGSGTDSSERGRVMWARIKGRTENALLRLPFKAAVMLRPAGIQPMHGERSKTPLYRVFYRVGQPLLPLLRRLVPGWLTTTEDLGRLMIRRARTGAPKPVLESRDIAALAARNGSQAAR
jgi:uncharacterized protein YbjT (DUF2867 family)